MAPPQSYGPDPSTAASIQALMQMHAEDRRANSIDRGLAGMAASFGPLETRNAIMGSAQPQDDRLEAMRQATLLQNAQVAQTEHSRAQAGAEALGVNMGLKPGEGTELGNLGQLGAVAGATLTPSPEQKQANEAAEAYAQAHPEMTPEQIATYKSGILTNMDDPAARAANIDMATKVAEAKNPAAFTAADTRADAVKQNIDWLIAHPSESQRAVNDPDFLTTGALSHYLPSPIGESNTTLEAKARLDQLQNQLAAANLQGSGMSRMAVLEFSKLGGAMSTLGQKGLPPDAVTQELNRLRDSLTRVHANIKAQSGTPLDATYSGYADPRYFDKSSPYYSGATVTKGAPAPGSMGGGALPEAAGVNDLSKLAGNEIGKAYDALPPGSTYVGPDGKTRKKQ
jgi:hypothetical protein